METRNPERTDQEKIEYLRGQVNALFPFILAAMRTHPDPLLVQRLWIGSDEFQQANALPNTDASEHFMAGQDDTRGRLANLFAVVNGASPRAG